MRALNLMRAALLAAVIAVTAGCSLSRTPYERQDLPEVDSFPLASRYLGEAIKEEFWRDFEDPLLNSCIERALAANYDIRTAQKKVEQALLSLDISRTDLHPTAEARLGIGASKDLSAGGAMSKRSSSSFGVSYEADVFGKIASANLSAFENFRATAYDYWAMRLTVIDAVASAYWDYAYAREAVKLGISDLKDSERRLKLVTEQYREGAVSNVELDKAQIDHMGVKEVLDGRFNNLHKARNALNILLAQTPDHDEKVSSLDKITEPEFRLDIPAALLARRPDLMAAEARVRKALADYDSARLAFFPSFTLSASLEAGDGGTLYRFLRDPVGTLAAAVTLPFLNYNKLSLQQKSALTEREIADLSFAETYITAVSEVYDSVSDIDYYRRSLVTTRNRRDLSRRNYQGYFHRYSEGSSPLSDLLDASDTMRTAEINHLQMKRDLLKSVLGLMIALGGDTELKSAYLSELTAASAGSAVPAGGSAP